ncbi:MAG: class I SAM-dependent methyltransferase [Pyrinomonadaceae bacterium]
MNILKEVILNQLIKIPAVKIKAKKHHQTGISHHPEFLIDKYNNLTKYASVKGKHVLELGPGKTIEVMLKAKADGASSVAIVDIEKYLTTQQTLDNGINYKIYDGRKIPFPDESFDLIWSSDVYEHIRFPQITVEETYRLLRPGGMVIHLIDLRDHFSFGNNPDLIFNCLKYPKWLWEMMTWNRSNYINRLRASEWIKIHESAGFKIINNYTEISDYIRDNYKTKSKLKYLLKYSEYDIISTGMHLVAKK